MGNSQDKYILAIDLGTSGPKVALYTTSGGLISSEHEKNQVLLLPDGGAEQSPNEWWVTIKAAIHRLLAKTPISPEDILAICCTSQWSGTVAVDQDGNPLMNAIIWMDSRGAPYIQQITRGLINVEGFGMDKLFTWIRLTGGIPGQAGKDSIAHILYIKYQLPEIYRQTYKFMEPKDYLNLLLTGKFAASTDSITLYWLTDTRDISNVVYHDRLIEMSGIDREKLPELKIAVDILGTIKPQIAAELGLPENVQVVMGTPDVQSAAIGAGAVRDFDTYLYIGTSSWLSCHVPFKKTDLFHNIASLPSAIPGRYVVANEQQSAGVCINYLRDNLIFPDDELTPSDRPEDIYSAFEGIASSVSAGSGRTLFTPWLYGERTPVDDRFVRGSFFNISLQTTRAHLIRAVYEGVALNTRWLFEYVEKFVNHRLDTINITGGGANSNLWCQIYADVLNRSIRQVKDPIQVNTRGAALLASVALGYLTFEDAAKQVPIAATYNADPDNRLVYDQLFQEFVGLYERNRKAFTRLNRERHG